MTLTNQLLNILSDKKGHSYKEIGKKLTLDPFKIFMICAALKMQKKVIIQPDVVENTDDEFIQAMFVRLI